MDAKTFSHYYAHWYHELYRFAYCMMRHPHDAEDAVADAMVSAYKNADQLKDISACKPWMFTILANTCKRLLGAKDRASVQTPTDLERASDAQVTPDAHLDMADALSLRQASAQLPDEDRLIVALSVFGGFTSQEIGEILGKNANTVRSKQKRALAKLAALMEGVKC